MKTIGKIILSAVLLLSVSGCGSGKKSSEDTKKNSEVSAEKVKMKETQVYGIKINVPDDSSVTEKDGWTTFARKQADTRFKIRTVNSEEAGKIGAFCDSVEKSLKQDNERTKYLGGCKFTYMTNSSNGTMTNPTSLYVYPVKSNEIYVLAVVYNMDFEESLKNADYNNAFASYTEAPKETEAPAEEVKEEQPQEEPEEETVEEENNSSDFEEFKKKMDDIEAFFDSYVEFMKSYDMTDTSKLSQYMDFLSKYEEAMNALDSIDVSTLTPEEDAYYTQAMIRIDKKLLEAAEALQ